jgi:hypothetical protein
MYNFRSVKRAEPTPDGYMLKTGHLENCGLVNMRLKLISSDGLLILVWEVDGIV